MAEKDYSDHIIWSFIFSMNVLSAITSSLYVALYISWSFIKNV